MSEKHEIVVSCDVCGFTMKANMCRLNCPNCGYQMDCSDTTIHFPEAKLQDTIDSHNTSGT